jgi:hypothetical protein
MWFLEVSFQIGLDKIDNIDDQIIARSQKIDAVLFSFFV